MRHLILQMQMSADGFVSAADSAADWLMWNWGEHCPWDEPLKRRFNDTFLTIDTVLLSRPMANDYTAHWTGMAERRADDPDFAFAQRVARAHKLVISRQEVALHWPRMSAVHGALVEEVNALKQQPGGDIIAFGGVRLASALLDAGVVDELQFYVNPAAAGAGQSVFSTPRRLQLLDAAPYGCGIVLVRYRP